MNRIKKIGSYIKDNNRLLILWRVMLLIVLLYIGWQNEQQIRLISNIETEISGVSRSMFNRFDRRGIKVRLEDIESLLDSMQYDR